MVELEMVVGSTQALATIALVLVEASALYLGYGAVIRLTGPAVMDAIEG